MFISITVVLIIVYIPVISLGAAADYFTSESQYVVTTLSSISATSSLSYIEEYRLPEKLKNY